MKEAKGSMQGKVCAVTGANRGIGRAMAHGLAARGATVVMMCRNEESGAAAAAEVANVTKNKEVHLLQADLTSQESIRRTAKLWEISADLTGVEPLSFEKAR